MPRRQPRTTLSRFLPGSTQTQVGSLFLRSGRLLPLVRKRPECWSQHPARQVEVTMARLMLLRRGAWRPRPRLIR
jgi:hypothetical protein